MLRLSLVSLLFIFRVDAQDTADHDIEGLCHDTNMHSKSVVCYYAGYLSSDKLDPCLCTHLLLTDWKIGPDLKQLSHKRFRELEFVKNLKKKNANLQVGLVLFGNTEDSIWAELIARNKQASALAFRTIAFLSEMDLDGIAIDYDPSSVERKNNFTALIKSFREALDLSLPTNSSHKRFLMVNVARDFSHISQAYDFAQLSKLVDLFYLPAYNFTDENSEEIIHPSPLMGSDGENADSLVDLLLSLNTTAKKIILGLPLFGVFYHLEEMSENSTDLVIEGERDFAPYQQICKALKSGDWIIERAADKTETRALGNLTWVGYDDSASIRIKSKYALLRNLGGVGIWYLDQDDFNNTCGEGNFPLVRAAHTIFDELTNADQTRIMRSFEEDIDFEEAEAQLSEVSVPRSGRSNGGPFRITRIVDRTGQIHMIQDPSQTNLICTRPGFYRVPEDCSRFYRCVKFNQFKDDFVIFEYDCPSGLVFDEKWEVCNWASATAPCGGSSEIMPVPRSKFICPSEGYFTDPENCRWFYKCDDFLRDGVLTAFEFRCPFDLAFDESNIMCNWRWLVPGCGDSGHIRPPVGPFPGERPGHSLGTNNKASTLRPPLPSQRPGHNIDGQFPNTNDKDRNYPNGPNGPNGPFPNGPAGPDGPFPNGPAGPNGPFPSGPSGPNGPFPGDSSGNNGNGGGFGPNGPQGSGGPNGFGGRPGSDGPNGFNGHPGSVGPNGFGGRPGSDGPNGFNGHPGSVGPNGFGGRPGSDGPNGFGGAPGSDGPNGFGGHPGSDGPNGFSGPPGFGGPSGSVGPGESFGPNAFTGSTIPFRPQSTRKPVVSIRPNGISTPNSFNGGTGPVGPHDGSLGPIGPDGSFGLNTANGFSRPFTSQPSQPPTVSIRPSGFPHPVGPNGDSGSFGPGGTPGSFGPSGAPGSFGPSGAPGSFGPSGAPGGTSGSFGSGGVSGPHGSSLGPGGSFDGNSLTGSTRPFRPQPTQRPVVSIRPNGISQSVGPDSSNGFSSPDGSTGPAGSDGSFGPNRITGSTRQFNTHSVTPPSLSFKPTQPPHNRPSIITHSQTGQPNGLGLTSSVGGDGEFSPREFGLDDGQWEWRKPTRRPNAIEGLPIGYIPGRIVGNTQCEKTIDVVGQGESYGQIHVKGTGLPPSVINEYEPRHIGRLPNANNADNAHATGGPSRQTEFSADGAHVTGGPSRQSEFTSVNKNRGGRHFTSEYQNGGDFHKGGAGIDHGQVVVRTQWHETTGKAGLTDDFINNQRNFGFTSTHFTEHSSNSGNPQLVEVWEDKHGDGQWNHRKSKSSSKNVDINGKRLSEEEQIAVTTSGSRLENHRKASSTQFGAVNSWNERHEFNQQGSSRGQNGNNQQIGNLNQKESVNGGRNTIKVETSGKQSTGAWNQEERNNQAGSTISQQSNSWQGQRVTQEWNHERTTASPHSVGRNDFNSAQTGEKQRQGSRDINNNFVSSTPVSVVSLNTFQDDLLLDQTDGFSNKGFSRGPTVILETDDRNRIANEERLSVRWQNVTALVGPVHCSRAGLFRHPDDCSLFYECFWDRWLNKFTIHYFECPVRLAFDHRITGCNWPFRGPHCEHDN